MWDGGKKKYKSGDSQKPRQHWFGFYEPLRYSIRITVFQYLHSRYQYRQVGYGHCAESNKVHVLLSLSYRSLQALFYDIR